MRELYIKLDRHVRIWTPCVKVADIAGVFCTDEALKHQVEMLKVWTFESEAVQKKIITILEIYELIDQKMKNEIRMNSVGEDTCVIEYVRTKDKKKLCEFAQVLFVGCIVFFGAAFSIMSYNEDAAVQDVFEKICMLLTGNTTLCAVLEFGYALGLAAGILIFFNRIGNQKKRIPTVTEIQMTQYEKEIVDASIKLNERHKERK